MRVVTAEAGELVQLALPKKVTVASLKRKVADLKNISSALVFFLHEGKRLGDSTPLDVEFRGSDTLFLARVKDDMDYIEKHCRETADSPARDAKLRDTAIIDFKALSADLTPNKIKNCYLYEVLTRAPFRSRDFFAEALAEKFAKGSSGLEELQNSSLAEHTFAAIEEINQDLTERHLIWSISLDRVTDSEPDDIEQVQINVNVGVKDYDALFKIWEKVIDAIHKRIGDEIDRINISFRKTTDIRLVSGNKGKSLNSSVDHYT